MNLSSKSEQIEYSKQFGIRNPWWIDNPEEKYWFELLKIESNDRFFDPKDKKKITWGKQIWAPHYSPNNPRVRIYSYSLVNFVKKGDIIFHYVSEKRGIVGYSIAKSNPYDDVEYWGSAQNEKKPVYKVDLKDPVTFEKFLSLDDIREKQIDFLNYQDQNPKIQYTPFHKGPNLISEGYLFKFPKEFLNILDIDEYYGKNSIESKKKNQKLLRNLKEIYKQSDQKLVIKDNPYEGKIPETNPQKKPNKDRKEMVYNEAVLEAKFIEHLRKLGFSSHKLNIGNYKNDIFIKEKNILIECKGKVEAPEIRMVIGQIKHYDYLLDKENKKPDYVAALFPEKPSIDFMNILSKENIYVIWETHEGNFDSNLTENFFR